MKQEPNSVVREIRTLRCVGIRTTRLWFFLPGAGQGDLSGLPNRWGRRLNSGTLGYDFFILVDCICIKLKCCFTSILSINWRERFIKRTRLHEMKISSCSARYRFVLSFFFGWIFQWTNIFNTHAGSKRFSCYFSLICSMY